MKTIWDGLSDCVKSITGEKERREYVDKINALGEVFSEELIERQKEINSAILSYNNQVKKLNQLRNGEVKKSIESLYMFLKKYGNCKMDKEYAEERMQREVIIPEQELQNLNLIENRFDWDRNQVFGETLVAPIGIRRKTHNMNVQLKKTESELLVKIDNELTEIDQEIQMVRLENDICRQYQENIELINKTINYTIEPELKLTDAFFKAESIKNAVISGNILVEYNYDIMAIKNTIYNIHFNFIKNVFSFYIFACRVFNTPVLTKLLYNNMDVGVNKTRVSEQDMHILKKENKGLTEQIDNIKKSTMIERNY